jgi:hypothetical protein
LGNIGGSVTRPLRRGMCVEESKMTRKFAELLVVAVAVFVLTGCGKKPAEEISTTQSAVDAVMAAGAETYAPEVAAEVKGDLDAAMAEVKLQDGKTFKSYGKAKEMLAAVKAKSEGAVATVETKKEEAKQNAMAAQQSARTALEEASSLVKQAPAGKGTTEDIEALKSDVKGLEESLPEVQKLLDSGDYMAALEKATSIEGKAKEVSSQITAAIEKTKMARKKK